MVNYTYVRLSSDIHSGSDITRSGSDIQYLLIQNPFGYFATSIRISVRVRFRISGKMPTSTRSFVVIILLQM